MAHGTLNLPGSILLSGVMALLGLVYQNDINKGNRIEALNDTGVFRAIALAMRKNPRHCTLDGSEQYELADRDYVLRLLAILLGEQIVKATVTSPPLEGVDGSYHPRIDELMDSETKQTLIGTLQAPGLLLEKFIESMENDQGGE